MNATLLQQHLRSATGTTVSTQAVRNRFHGVGLYARRSMEYFHLEGPGSRNNPAFVHESVRFGGGVVLVYGGISIDGRTDLYIIRDGPLTARRYRDEILRPIVVPYAAAIGDNFILIDDNCRPHRANLVEDFLFEEGIVRMEWPACSPDMNPIEHVWDALGRRVAGRQPPPQTLQELERALLEEWDRIPQLVINSLIDSMPQRAPTKESFLSLEMGDLDVLENGLPSVRTRTTFAPEGGIEQMVEEMSATRETFLGRLVRNVRLQETKLPVRQINATNERRLFQGHKTRLKVKEDIEDVSSELDDRG
ncbi:transposable element Tcb1 transposase [Trichonephila clavipes]|uniref:Transposable element Tcb1 transposase n=1 Tax=Trichonephila clavipes TaxID=2585209 RepID=A0A8X7B8U8_TRICX|nr:transposable element Tcb1 transposase [Trichonephila clavipes]